MSFQVSIEMSIEYLMSIEFLKTFAIASHVFVICDVTVSDIERLMNNTLNRH
jgi:hypothetical protein